MSREPIAIVGIGCRLPGGGNDPREFWKLLCDGVDGIREVPADRWSADAHYDPVPGRNGKSITRWAGFVDGIDRFDAGFFGISPREAEFMDPQQRLLLETAWEALEDAGQPPGELRGSPTGVFVGVSTHDYELLQSSPDERSDLDIYTTTGGVPSIAANRISYCFDLRGPSLAVDTACSSSLIAAHLACQSLWNGDARLALVGGVNALLAPMPFVAFSRMSMLSPTGRCRAFDAAADGFVRAEGAGVVVLKRLGEALAAGDRVYAVIRATAANQDGRTHGITVPSAAAQAALVRDACRRAGVSPAAVAYVEAHGTGTPVGDPIEASALGEALGSGRAADRPCVVGSVKTNIGHLEAGAGIAGLIKLALVLHHGRIPPNLHFRNPNPNIDFERLKLRVPVAVEDLRAGGGEPAVAGINSFGFGGSNAHAVLQAAPVPARSAARAAEPARTIEPERAIEPQAARLLVVSAATAEALRAAAVRTEEMLSGEPGGGALDEICRTAGERRAHHAERVAVVGRDRREIAERLGAFAAGEVAPGVVAGRPLAEGRPEVAFVFSGQGPQWWGMGRELAREEPVFRAKLEECDRELARHAGWRLRDELARDEGSSRLAETAIAQPAIFALQVALAALWESWGIRPAAVVGHSVGEVAAAHVAGVLTLADAAHVIFQRGRCMDLAPERGRMLAVRLSAAAAAELVAPYDGRVAVGAVNAPASVTLSGDGAALEEIAAALARSEVSCRFLPVNYAFHSPQMDPVRDELLRSLGSFARARARSPMISTVTGGELAGEELSAEYWWRNVRETVRFAPAIDALLRRGSRIFLEIAAHPALAAAVGECLRERSLRGVVLPSLRRREPERATLLGSLGALHVAGVPVDWRGLYPEARALASLPAYPWQRDRFWHESPGSRERRLDPALHPFLVRDVKAAQPTWEGWIDRQAMPYLADHRVQGHVVFPAAGYVEVAAEAAERRFGASPWMLEDVDLVRALVVPEAEETPRLQIALEPAESRFTISSALGAEAGGWSAHCTGKLRAAAQPGARERIALGRVRARCRERLSPDDLYRRFRAVGIEFGPAFRGVERLWRRGGEALGRVRAPEPIAATIGRYRLHPALLDACFQVLSATLPDAAADGERLYLPVRIDRLEVRARPGRTVWSHARLRRRAGNSIVGDLRVTDDSGAVLAVVEGFRCQAMRAAADDDPESWLYESRWEARPLRGREAPRLAAADLAPPARAAGAARAMLAQRQHLGGARARFLAVEPALDELCSGYVAGALADLGWKPRCGLRFTTESLARELRVVARLRSALGRFLEFLAADGVLDRAGGGWRVRRPAAPVDVAGLWRELLARFPALYPELVLLRRAGGALAPILRGRLDPLGAIAPAGSLAVLEQLYQDAPSFADYNRAVAVAVAAAVGGAAAAGRTVRLLEIGAGTGGTTAHLLPLLPPDVEYVFSDVSPSFFSRAEQKFFEYPRLRCQLLDVERPPAEQGFEPHSCDVVLAADALHATARLAESLAHVRELLAPGGLLVLLEIDRPTRWVDLVFGLTPGWWRSRDPERRVHPPLLDRAGWRAALAAAGFEAAADVPDARAPRRSGQTIFLARAPRAERAPAARPPEPTAAAGGRSWLLLADRGGVAERLAVALAAQGDRTKIAFAAPRDRDLGAGRCELDARSPDSLRRLLAALPAAPDGVVHLWGLDDPPAAETTLATLLESERRGPLSALHLVQALGADDGAKTPQLWLVTRGSQPAGGTEVSPAQAPLWGLGRVIQNEQRRLRCRMIDLDPRGAPAEVAQLLAELGADDAEEEIALRGEARYANRLVRASFEDARDAPRAAAPSYRLEIPSPGALDAARLTARARRRPRAGEVEIEVRAAALNFRDVMKALGIYPVENDEDLLAGDECAGRVVAVGPGVAGLREGDEVLAMGAGCFASHLTVDAGRVARIPRGLSFEEAATIPVVFLTAWYALRHLGQMRRGERLLVQAATGGVGLAALQIAELVGAEVFATAGSPEKRDFLRALGVARVMDSRSLAFAEQVLEATAGRGVDLVLNSLAGEAIAKGLSLLAPHGRFLEIGKRDVYQDTRVGLRPFRNGLSMFVIDLPQVMRDQPALTRGLIGEILGAFASRRLRPLPQRTFPVSEIGAALRFMAKAQHVGKIVVSMDDGGRVRPHPGRAAATRLRADATYLVTGGLGGFGLALAEWMVDNGARCLVLAGRRGAATREARRAVAALRRRGARVLAARTDAADARAVARLFRRIDRSLPPLRGVFHAAMVLDDGVLAQLDADRLRRVMAPKVDGAWNLHVHSQPRRLDHFVLFSSVSSVVGAPAQGNYVAANGFLDALAHHRRARGLPALAVDWGQLAEVGYVARHEKVAEHLTRQGILGIAPKRALDLLGRLLRGRAAQVGVVRVDWQRWASFLPAVATAPRYGALVGAGPGAGTADAGRGAREAVLEALPEQRLALAVSSLREQVGRVLRMPAAKLDATRPLSELGVDSLMAFELVNRLESQFQLTLPAGKLAGEATIERLAAVLLEALTAAPSGGADGAGAAGATPPDPARAERIVALRAEGARPPLFCIHPAGGLANIYRHLADALPAGLPVDAVQSRAIAEGVAEQSALPALAEEYATRIVECRPSGPYRLLGFSLGGILAVAVARVLEQRGAPVALVALVDADLSLTAPGRRTDAYVKQHIVDMYGTFARELGVLRRLDRAGLDAEAADLAARVIAAPAGERSAAIVAWLTERGHLLPGISAALLERYFALFDAHVALVEGCAPERIHAPLVVWHRGHAGNGEPPSLGAWRRCTAGEIEERVIEGNHYDLMYPPLVDRLALELDAALRRTEDSAPPRPARGAPVEAVARSAPGS